MTLVIYLVQSVYLHLANKLVSGADIKFGQWFSFSTWTAFVGVFGVFAAFIAMFMHDGNQMSNQDLQVLSMNSLFIHAKAGEPWFTWASSLSLLNLWTLVLMSIGYARWTDSGTAKSAIIAILPWFLIFGIWAATI